MKSHLAIKEKKEKLDKNKGIFQFCGGCFAAQNYMKTNVVYMFFFFTHILIIKHNILLSSKKSPNLFSHIHMKQAEELPGELFPRGCRSVCHVWWESSQTHPSQEWAGVKLTELKPGGSGGGVVVVRWCDLLGNVVSTVCCVFDLFTQTYSHQSIKAQTKHGRFDIRPQTW